jgi:hypothetical protein
MSLSDCCPAQLEAIKGRRVFHFFCPVPGTGIDESASVTVNRTEVTAESSLLSLLRIPSQAFIRSIFLPQ